VAGVTGLSLWCGEGGRGSSGGHTAAANASGRREEQQEAGGQTARLLELIPVRYE